MSSFSDRVRYKDFDIFDSSLGRLVPNYDKSISSLLRKRPVDGLRLTQPVWSKTENLLRSASQVLGTAEHFLAATGHLLNSEDSVVPAEVRPFLLELDKALEGTPSAKKGKNNYGKPQNKSHNSDKSSGGLTLQFKNPPPLSEVPISLSHIQDPVRYQLLSVEVDTMLQKSAIEEVPLLTLFPRFYPRHFLVPRKTGGMRPVIYLSILNNFLIVPHFKMEINRSIRASILPGMWTTSLDL
ncbi:Hypothetical predicted protein [Mytilus galloprovincialis]|uniref:Uncharacterized protein n=1 Tax=Mytilus galloprovincialis TaxID=29158 RepID=A0A8B6DQH8_MYTGA|nr:Hypothetical predicted protein [Mytilus galloprovincialis]